VHVGHRKWQRKREGEREREILPDPVGPIKRTLLFSSSTKFSSSSSSDNKRLPVLSSLKQVIVSMCHKIIKEIKAVASNSKRPSTFTFLLCRFEFCSLQSLTVNAFVMVIYGNRENLKGRRDNVLFTFIQGNTGIQEDLQIIY
jgi:hypothetical protein